MTLRLGDTLIAGSGANQDLSNLTSQGKNIANWSSNVTNCITEIPQDIKLELNNGTLTLKAGSKVYVPNGVGVFDEVTIASDLTTTYTIAQTLFVFYDNSSNSLRLRYSNQVYSGTTTPTSEQNEVWYDTTNNIIKYSDNYGSSWSRQYSFPICLITSNTTQITSIDRIFNGFGYIGSTVFALPGVKGLIPNGRNADGSLKNIAMEVTNVQTLTYTDDNPNELYAGITPSGTITLNGLRTYNEAENFIYNGDNSALHCEFAKYRNPSGKIADFTLKTSFHALDYNDSSTISGWGMPSSRYIDLTLGASGTTYRAPANGWFGFVAAMGGTDGYAILYHSSLAYANKSSSNNNGSVYTTLPILKGESAYLFYSAQSLSSVTWRFYYAEGENV